MCTAIAAPQYMEMPDSTNSVSGGALRGQLVGLGASQHRATVDLSESAPVHIPRRVVDALQDHPADHDEHHQRPQRNLAGQAEDRHDQTEQQRAEDGRRSCPTVA